MGLTKDEQDQKKRNKPCRLGQSKLNLIESQNSNTDEDNSVVSQLKNIDTSAY